MRPYFLGCPMWANKEWVGRFFTRGVKNTEMLAQYSQVFSSVEGNTVFYALPSSENIARWKEEVPEGFHFCMKFPHIISHEKMLHNVEDELTVFFERMAPLGSLLGPYFLLLPKAFQLPSLPLLERLLQRVPEGAPCAVEVRHISFFSGLPERRLNELLHRYGADRVITDTRGVYRAIAEDPNLKTLRSRKPQLPEKPYVTGKQPFLRLICHPTWEKNLDIMEYWADAVAHWIEQGLRPYVFLHSPEDIEAPDHARKFHALLQQRIELDDLPPTPMDVEGGPREQLALF
ncbi:MAG: DUF72 domain-containing protein [Myxococcales bacterium]|nr:DUF72 domain-containing protein [Myxococcales bacterium]